MSVALNFVRPLLIAACAVLLLCVAVAPADDAAPKPKATRENPLPGRFPAPPLEGGAEWLNTDKPIKLEDLRGKVVLLDFWTYCCINCIHILPDLKYLEEKYAKELVVIGVHSAKFENERDTENIRQAILRYEIAHPVVNDNQMAIARRYFFQSWPTVVVIDPQGNYVGRVSGEGQRETLDKAIGQIAAWHRENGTLNETPMTFALERQNEPPTPLRYPGKIVTDEAGDRLFISDSNNNRIVITTLDGKLLEVIGTGAIGSKNGNYNEAEFDHPQGMALVGDTLYVADTENHLLRAIDLKAKRVTKLAGTGKQGSFRATGGRLASTALNSPWAIAHLNGTLFICMAGPHQLWRHRIGTEEISVYAGNGREDIVDGSLSDSSLAQPSGITHDGQTLYFVDSEGSAVRKATIGRQAGVTTIAGPHDMERGRSLFEFGDIDGVGDEARFQHPLGVLYHEGGLFVADTYNHKIRHVDLATRAASTWLGTGKRGNGLDPVELSEPAGLAMAQGRLYIADTNNHRILTVDLKTKATQVLTIEGLTPPAKK